MNIPIELKQLTDEVHEAKRILYETMTKRINWCHQNRKEIKKYYPILKKIYQIIDIKKALKDDWRFENLHDDVYFFRATDIRFNPKLDFNTYYRDENPTVKGDILDCNSKIVYRSERISITNIKEIEDQKQFLLLSNNLTKVYLMFDKNTGYYKIGRSKNPLARERTLQSEKPTIEILHTFDARVINEKELHNMFSDKRIRGEWFNLNGSDIQTVKKFFRVNDFKNCI